MTPYTPKPGTTAEQVCKLVRLASGCVVPA